MNVRRFVFLAMLLWPMLAAAQSHIEAGSAGGNPCSQGWAEFPRVDPRNPDIICLPELGRMEGSITTSVSFGNGEGFGHEIHALGRLTPTGLAAWTLNHYRCDVSGKYPYELLLYRGVKGGLPSVSSGERIGPSELGSDTRLLASGDFDADGNVDLVCRIELYADTSFGNDGTQPARVVVFWGSSQGDFSLTDTTRLLCDADGWYGPYGAVACDFDEDGIEDVLIWNWEGAGRSNGQVVAVPKMFIYCGHNGERWGHDGRSNSADWRWWEPPFIITQLAVGDQDADGHNDVYFYDNPSAGTGHTSILYGSAGGGLPDTNNIETIDLLIANGKRAYLSDLTGDKIPELVMTSGGEQRLKVFIGLKGQRLKEQYGPGHASIDTANPHWWKRPWAELWCPNKINDYWFATDDEELFNLSDATGDGASEIWSMSWPFVLIYTAGDRSQHLDSLVDAMIDIRPGEGVVATANLGDIDGSGKSTMALCYDKPSESYHPYPGGIVFVQPSLAVSREGEYRRLPEGTGPKAGGVEGRGRRAEDGGEAITLTAVPNPTTGSVHLQWRGEHLMGTAIVAVYNASGAEIHRCTANASTGELKLPVDGLTPGAYFIMLHIGTQSATTQVVVR